MDASGSTGLTGQPSKIHRIVDFLRKVRVEIHAHLRKLRSVLRTLEM